MEAWLLLITSKMNAPAITDGGQDVTAKLQGSYLQTNLLKNFLRQIRSGLKLVVEHSVIALIPQLVYCCGEQ